MVATGNCRTLEDPASNTDETSPDILFFSNPFSSVRLLSWVHAKYKLPIMDAFESKYTKSARELGDYSAVDMLCLHSADRPAANASPDVSFLSGRSPEGLCTRREH